MDALTANAHAVCIIRRVVLQDGAKSATNEEGSTESADEGQRLPVCAYDRSLQEKRTHAAQTSELIAEVQRFKQMVVRRKAAQKVATPGSVKAAVLHQQHTMKLRAKPAPRLEPQGQQSSEKGSRRIPNLVETGSSGVACSGTGISVNEWCRLNGRKYTRVAADGNNLLWAAMANTDLISTADEAQSPSFNTFEDMKRLRNEAVSRAIGNLRESMRAAKAGSTDEQQNDTSGMRIIRSSDMMDIEPRLEEVIAGLESMKKPGFCDPEPAIVVDLFFRGLSFELNSRIFGVECVTTSGKKEFIGEVCCVDAKQALLTCPRVPLHKAHEVVKPEDIVVAMSPSNHFDALPSVRNGAAVAGLSTTATGVNMLNNPTTAGSLNEGSWSKPMSNADLEIDNDVDEDAAAFDDEPASRTPPHKPIAGKRLRAFHAGDPEAEEAATLSGLLTTAGNALGIISNLDSTKQCAFSLIRCAVACAGPGVDVCEPNQCDLQWNSGQGAH